MSAQYDVAGAWMHKCKCKAIVRVRWLHKYRRSTDYYGRRETFDHEWSSPDGVPFYGYQKGDTPYVRCAGCGEPAAGTFIRAKASDHPCDAACTSAKGHVCECQCQGANHGIDHAPKATVAP